MESIELRATNPHPAADAHRRQLALVKPTSDRLLVELQQLGNLNDGQELVGHLALTESNRQALRKRRSRERAELGREPSPR
jgi:hypothetical protein